MNKNTPAQNNYKTAKDKLFQFCEDNTNLSVLFLDETYPFRVQFIPNTQQSLFGDENVSEDGEVNDLTVTIGQTTTVKSCLKFKMDSKLLKKLIKQAETVGSLYYHAYREAEGVLPQMEV